MAPGPVYWASRIHVGAQMTCLKLPLQCSRLRPIQVYCCTLRKKTTSTVHRIRCSSQASAASSDHKDVLREAQDLGALAPGGDIIIQGSKRGKLQGLTFSVKDMYDVEGYVTGFGNPTWLKTHNAAEATAPVVQALLDAGATLVGKSAMDELAFSLAGENVHYGTPLNSAAPERIPGGSSSGSAAMVAAGLVDFALGSDTAGSVRVPASYCGILGMRPTHGRISMQGACPLAPSLDTVGWFAKDPDVLRRVGEVLLGDRQLALPAGRETLRWLVSTDAFSVPPKETASAVYVALSTRIKELTERFGTPAEVTVSEIAGVTGLQAWLAAMRVIQMHEVWGAHGEWITSTAPKFGPGVSERFEAASKVTQAAVDEAADLRVRMSLAVDELLDDQFFLAVPAAPGPAPLRGTPPDVLDPIRQQTMMLTTIAGAAGVPQITIPIAMLDGAPIGLGLIGPRGRDLELLDVACGIMELLNNNDQV